MASHHNMPPTSSAREISPACVQEKRPCLQSSHVIFDLDGILLDSEGVIEAAWDAVCRRYGKEMTLEARVLRMGATQQQGTAAVVRQLELPVSPEEMARQISAEEPDRVAHCRLMPGAERLVRHLYSHNVPLAVATSNSQEDMEIKLSNYPDVKSCFHHIVCGGNDPEVKNSKPAPDIFLVTASRFPGSPQPRQVLVFEDSVTGVQAAIAAGMNVVAVPSPLISQQLVSGASLVLDSLENFHPEYYGFPPF